ncbi:MAG: protein phosphatase 2C domain-containing protein [Cyanobacteria bacterium P01_D01_bin.105]
MINCPNPSCKTLNPEGNEVCQACQSVLPHRYLWGVGKSLSTLRPGDLYRNRYLLKRNRIFLDTYPGVVPETLAELPEFLQPYLHLSAYPVHTPKPYAVMRASADDYVLMLESSALSTPAVAEAGKSVIPTQLPTLSARWAEAPPLRQLSWLHQISQLWTAFQSEQVASTLLTDEFVRVDGAVVRLLELMSLPVASTHVRAKLQPTKPPTLMALGRYWQPLADSAHQSIRAFLNRLCEQLERQQLNAEQLTEQLSQAVSECAIDQVVSCDVVVYTDQGPTRKRNEDACYPASGTSLTLSSEQTQQAPQLLIVCDGIGGHQGGDVASKLAISTIESRLKPLLSNYQTELTSTQLTLAIEEAICAANDEISAQNDQAQRQARDRMGTTLVMALVKGADVYIAHLGDSRAYRIGPRNCQQVTLDDDVASRQVRLGGSLYREVLMQPGAGSLIQALGMNSSQTLRPTVQRFVLDESCVFLLCSDGLSDGDRVEQFWQKVLQPLVTTDGATAEAGQQLMNLANKCNGHDNVTVGLLRTQVVRSSERMLPRELVNSSANTVKTGAKPVAQKSTVRGANRGTTRIISVPSQISEPTQTSRPTLAHNDAQNDWADENQADRTTAGRATAHTSNRVKNIGLLLGLLAITGTVLYFLFPGLSWRFKSASDTENAQPPAVITPSGEPTEDTTAAVSTPEPLADLSAGSYLRIRQTDIPAERPSANTSTTTSAGEAASAQQLVLYPNPTVGPNDIPGSIPTGGIIQVLEQRTAEETAWARVKLCSIPSGESIADAPSETNEPAASPTEGEPLADNINQPLILSPDAEGWAVVSQLAAVSDNIQDLEPTQQGRCES